MIIFKDKTDEYTIKVEEGFDGEGKGFLFLHLEAHKFNKTVFKDLREMLDDYIDECGHKGYEKVSFYLEKDQSTKFHNTIRPLDYLVPFGYDDEYLLGGWFTGD